MSSVNAVYPTTLPTLRAPVAPPAPMAPTLPAAPMAPTVASFQPSMAYTASGRSPMMSTQSTTPGGKVFAEFGGGDWVSTGGNLAHIYNMGKTGITGGKGVNSAFGQLFRALKGLHGNGIFAGIKGVAGAAIPFATQSALFEGAISAVVNGYYLFTGREGVGTFGGNVVGDTMSGLAGGAGAAIGGGIAMALLPFGGTMGLILTAIGGVLGYGAASSMLRSTGIYNKIVNGVKSALGGI